MKIPAKKLLTAVALTLTATLLAGCGSTDVVRQYSPQSFTDIVQKYPNLVTDTTQTDHYYNLTVDGSTVLKISHDYKMNGKDDIMISTPLKPFTDAGLDVAKLGDGYEVSGDTFSLTADYGDGSGQKDSATDALFAAADADRSNLSYHQKLDHYGMKLTAGKFEWAKDYTGNDKDIVFVIRAKPLADLGVDVHSISGWTFTTVQDTDGSNVAVLLKAYDLDKK